MSVLADRMLACWAIHAGLGLHALYRRQDLPLLHPVAFLDVQVSDPAEGSGSDIDVGLGLDLPRAADDGDQVFRTTFAVSTLVYPDWARTMVKVVMPAATRTAPEMINIFFSFMGRTVSPALVYIIRGTAR